MSRLEREKNKKQLAERFRVLEWIVSHGNTYFPPPPSPHSLRVLVGKALGRGLKIARNDKIAASARRLRSIKLEAFSPAGERDEGTAPGGPCMIQLIYLTFPPGRDILLSSDHFNVTLQAVIVFLTKVSCPCVSRPPIPRRLTTPRENPHRRRPPSLSQ